MDNTQADLVVHSMGGLVGRAYIQGNTYNDDVNKIIFLASPHQGFASTYRTHEGLTWSDYFENEVPVESGWFLVGELMDGILWPYLIEERYSPTPEEISQDCIYIPGYPEGGIPSRWDCKPAYYQWTHDPDLDQRRGVHSLPQMLPTDDLMDDLGAYLFDKHGIAWPCTGGTVPERNQWLEDLNNNIGNMAVKVGIENIYVLYSEEFPDLTDRNYKIGSFISDGCGGSAYNRWPYGGPAKDREHTAGDDLIPVESTTLLQSGLLPDLPPGNEFPVNVFQHGHKGIAYAPDAQRQVTIFLTGSGENLSFDNTEEYVKSFAIQNLIRIIAIIVRSPVSIMVTDPVGQRVGYDPATGETVAENLDAFYTGYNDEQFMLLYNTLTGDYQITVTGMAEGDYTIEMYAVEETGVRFLDIVTGTVTTGQILTYTTTYTTAETLLFNDDMESGDGHWDAVGGWSLQNDDAHSLVTAWDSGIITTNVPLTLTLQTSLDLSSAHLASLTFWHTYTLSSQAQLQIELSPDGGQTWQLLANQKGGTHGWSPASMSLSAFTGPSYDDVRLRFHLLPGDGGISRWRIDDVTVSLIAPPPLFDLPFQDDSETWRKWMISGNWTLSDIASFSPDRAWQANEAGSALTLVSPLGLQTADAPAFTFWYTMTTGGEGWVEVQTASAPGWQTAAIISPTATWTEAVLDLSPWVGLTPTLRLRHTGQPGSMWTVDDFTATETTPAVTYTLPLSDDMETPYANWGGVNGWQPITATAASGSAAWWSNTTNSSLVLQGQLDLTNTTTPVLNFQQQVDLMTGQVGLVKVLSADGLDWQTVLTVTGPITTWMPITADLSVYAGQQIKLAFVLEDSAGGGQSAVPDPARTVAAIALPITMLAVAMVGVGQITNKQDLRRWLKRLFLWSIALVVFWNCILWSGIWLSIPPLRAWRINNLSSIKGGTVDLVVSASSNPSKAKISPNGRWLMVSRGQPDYDQLLIDLETGEEQTLESYISGRWVADDLWAGEDSGAYVLMRVPDLDTTQFPQFDNSQGIDAVKELLWQSDHIYALEEGGAYYFLVTGNNYHYSVTFPGGITKEETEAFLAELPQVTIVPSRPSMTPTMVPEIDSYKPLRRFYSPDGSLYAQVEPIMTYSLAEEVINVIFPSYNRYPYLEVRRAADDELVARIHKKYYSPWPVGWSADGTGLYFQMTRPQPPESPVHVLWLPDKAVQAARDAMPDNQSSLLNSRRSSLFRMVTQLAMEPGWYIDDVRVEDVSSGTPTPTPTATNIPLPTNTPTATPTATNTPLPTATNTPLPTATNTPLPTVTNTPLPTATNTPPPSVTPTNTATSTPTATAAAACNLYPIALNVGTLAGVAPGQELEDILNGNGPGNFGWLTWSGNNSINTLISSLIPPGDSYSYVNPHDPADNTPSVGDWVNSRPGAANGKKLRQALDNLMPMVITVPVWDQVQGQGSNVEYQVSGYARVQISSYHLPGQDRISAVYWGAASCP